MLVTVGAVDVERAAEQARQVFEAPVVARQDTGASLRDPEVVKTFVGEVSTIVAACAFVVDEQLGAVQLRGAERGVVTGHEGVELRFTADQLAGVSGQRLAVVHENAIDDHLVVSRHRFPNAVWVGRRSLGFAGRWKACRVGADRRGHRAEHRFVVRLVDVEDAMRERQPVAVHDHAVFDHGQR